jgi:tubulin monoglycylase TTLL15
VNSSKGDDWDVLWALEFPFQNNRSDQFKPIFERRLLPHQRMNHFPGTEQVTNKGVMNAYNQEFDFILPTFKFPEMIERFKAFIQENPTRKIVKKNHKNRGVHIVDLKDINFEPDVNIYQMFVHNPFLIEGRAFDFGVFVLVSSINPLRIYKFDDEVLLRFCPQHYKPFDPKNIDKYVVYDNHLSYTDIKSLNKTCEMFGSSAKTSFEILLKKHGWNTDKMWKKIDDAIVKLLTKNEAKFMIRTEQYNWTSTNSFELFRFDFIFDDKLNVYLMEVNLSPNMTPQRYEHLAPMYEQIIHDTLKLVGAGSNLDLMSM